MLDYYNDESARSMEMILDMITEQQWLEGCEVWFLSAHHNTLHKSQCYSTKDAYPPEMQDSLEYYATKADAISMLPYVTIYYDLCWIAEA